MEKTFTVWKYKSQLKFYKILSKMPRKSLSNYYLVTLTNSPAVFSNGQKQLILFTEFQSENK